MKIPVLSIFWVLSLVCLTFRAAAQQPDAGKYQTVEDLIEEIAANSDEELDYTALYDDLNFFYQNPMNLNEARREDFERLQFLNQLQIQNLIDFLELGTVHTIYELQLVKGFSQQDIEQLLPFVRVGEAPPSQPFQLSRALKWGRHQVFLRSQSLLEEQKGYKSISDSVLQTDPDKNRYLGNRFKYYTRYKFHYKDKILWGFTAEKDPGEEFLSGVQKHGFDFYSAHLQVKDFGALKTAVVGDFQAQFGQGLVLWSGFSMGKSSYVLNTTKKARGLRKYSSTDENRFMRGSAATLHFGNIEISGFFSRKKIDANIERIDSIENDEILQVSNLQNTGLHATPSTVADRKAIDETIFGGNLTYRGDWFAVGITGAHTTYGSRLEKDLKAYQYFDFSGKENTAIGADYRFVWREFNFFGEAAWSSNGGMAFVNGFLAPLAPRVAVSVLHRHYQPGYYSAFAAGFGETSHTANENGLYLGVEIHPVRNWKLSAYFDSYEAGWLRYRTDAPSQGFEGFVQADFRASRNVNMYLRYRSETKPQNISEQAQGVTQLADVVKQSLRYHIAYRLSPEILLKNRVELSFYDKEQTHDRGFLVYQDVKYEPNFAPLVLNLRYAIFETDSYDARFYAYENDILYAFSIPAYYGKGTRFYATLKYDFGEHIDLWLRYSRTYFSGEEQIGSGLNEIQGNTRSEVKLQVRLKF